MTGNEYQKAALRTANIAQMNIDKLWKRYPDGFDPERSINRAEDDV